jgi:transposase
MGANSTKVIDHLQCHYPGATFKCVYESSAWGFNLQRRLSAAGMECIVVNAADVSTSDKERRRKTDQVDALKLARRHASGDLKAIHVPAEEEQKERNLVRYRKKIVGDLNRSKNRIKSLLKYEGIDIPEKFGKANWSHPFLVWVQQQAANDPLLGDVLDLMVEQVKFLRQLQLTVEKKLRKLMRTPKYKSKSELLISVPGVGPIVSSLFLLEVGDTRRFNSFDQLNDFVGFCPDTDSSGETNRDTGITRRRHKQLRTALIEAAWEAKRSDPVMLDAYLQLTKRMTGTKAIVRIARKLLRRMRAVLISGIPYQKGLVSSKQTLERKPTKQE